MEDSSGNAPLAIQKATVGDMSTKAECSVLSRNSLLLGGGNTTSFPHTRQAFSPGVSLLTVTFPEEGSEADKLRLLLVFLAKYRDF